MKPRPSLAVAIIAHNEERHLPALFNSLNDGSNPQFIDKVLLIDNNSSDATVAFAEQNKGSLLLEVFNLTTNNIGLARSKAVESCQQEFILFVDADCTVNNDWAKRYSLDFDKLTTNHPNLAGITSANFLPNTSSWKRRINRTLLSPLAHGGSPQGTCLKASKKVDHLPTTNALFKISSVLEVGNFSEAFARANEDVELGHRLCDYGFELVYVPGNPVINDCAQSLPEWLMRIFKFAASRVRLNKYRKALPNIASLGSLSLVLLFLVSSGLYLNAAKDPFSKILYLGSLSYIAIVIAESARIAFVYRKGFDLLFTAPSTALHMMLIHFSYGFGTLYGVFKEFIFAPISDLFKSPGQDTVSERA